MKTGGFFRIEPFFVPSEVIVPAKVGWHTIYQKAFDWFHLVRIIVLLTGSTVMGVGSSRAWRSSVVTALCVARPRNVSIWVDDDELPVFILGRWATIPSKEKTLGERQDKDRLFSWKVQQMMLEEREISITYQLEHPSRQFVSLHLHPHQYLKRRNNVRTLFDIKQKCAP